LRLARRHRGLGFGVGGLPLTSMIDVVFLLLIYFMVTVSATPPEADLASTLQQQSDKQSAAGDFQPQIVFVERGGGGVVYRLGAHTISERGELRRLLVELPKDSGVIVKVANDVPVESAAAALQTCKDAGFVKVSYVPSN
jgi:biopolymer transport protein ExbD